MHGSIVSREILLLLLRFLHCARSRSRHSSQRENGIKEISRARVVLRTIPQRRGRPFRACCCCCCLRPRCCRVAAVVAAACPWPPVPAHTLSLALVVLVWLRAPLPPPCSVISTFCWCSFVCESTSRSFRELDWCKALHSRACWLVCVRARECVLGLVCLWFPAILIRICGVVVDRKSQHCSVCCDCSCVRESAEGSFVPRFAWRERARVVGAALSTVVAPCNVPRAVVVLASPSVASSCIFRSFVVVLVVLVLLCSIDQYLSNRGLRKGLHQQLPHRTRHSLVVALVLLSARLVVVFCVPIRIELGY